MIINFNPFPVLSTVRLVLRQLKNEDAADLFVLRSNPALMKYIPRPIAKTVEDASAVIDMINGFIANNQSINWAITLKEEDKVIGMIGYVKISPENFRAEIGYMLHSDYHGKKIAEEALKAVVDFGFIQLKLHSIEAIVHPDNIASMKLLLKNNFEKEGYFRHFQFFEGKFIDAAIFSQLTPTI